MNGKLSIAVIVTALVISLIGLLNVVLGITSVISGALPSAEGQLIAPPIAVGSIIFGLMMLVVGALAFSSLIGSVSGILPARQAARLKPVDALRYE